MSEKHFITKCAWCGALHLHHVWLPGPLQRLFVRARPNTPISHGICESCLKSHFLMAYNESHLHRVGTPSGSRPVWR